MRKTLPKKFGSAYCIFLACYIYKPGILEIQCLVLFEVCEGSDYSTMLRIFSMRNPTNLTGRFPSTVALHAKVEELEDADNNHGSNIAGKINSRELQLPNIVQPLSLLPDWR